MQNVLFIFIQHHRVVLLGWLTVWCAKVINNLIDSENNPTEYNC